MSSEVTPLPLADPRGGGGAWLAVALFLGACPLLVNGQSLSHAVEPISPLPESPSLQGLPSRAVPDEDQNHTGQPSEVEDARLFVPLFRLNTPYYDNIFAPSEPEPPFRLDPSAYRAVVAYEPPQGLLPPHPGTQPYDFHPFAAVAESYDSNILQTTTNRISDTFTTLKLGFDLQAGTPDSLYVEGYDTILALNLHYEFFPDLFTNHTNFDAINQRLLLEGRIGRSAAIWRPFLTADDITGSNLLTVEREGRVVRQHLVTGVHADYRLTSDFTWSQTFSHLFFEHPTDASYINFEVWRSYQEVAYRALHDFDFFVWNEYRYTDADQGSDGEELINGIGWRGKPDPRLFSELLLGWDQQHLHDDIPGRRDQSGVRISGHTSFEWGPRLRLTLKYDRGYTFNEQTRNDNYVGNTLQFIPEIFLGGNWYLNPYFGISYDEYESSYQETLEVRPELELAYALPNASRVFVKIGYDHMTTYSGPPNPVDIYRGSVGLNWRF